MSEQLIGGDKSAARINDGKTTGKLGDYFKQRQESGIVGVPMMSVTMNDGLVLRDEIDRRTQTALTPAQHLLVCPGDIAYNMMRMWQGACGLAHAEAIISPAYVVLKPLAAIDSKFAYQWFKTKKLLHLFRAYSHGLTEDRLRLYFDDFCRIPAVPPPIAEQQYIVAVLSAWDQAIKIIKRLINVKQKRFESLLWHLIGRWQISGVYVDGWQREELSTLASFKSGGTPNRLEKKFWNGSIPWITAKDLKAFDIVSSVDFLTREGARHVNVAPVGATLLLVRGMGLFKDLPLGIATLPVAFNQDVKALVAKTALLPRFLTYALRAQRKALMNKVDSAGHGTGRLSTDFLEALPISFPSLVEQERIVDVLDTAQSDLATVLRELTAFRAQKHGLMQRLLTGEQQTDEYFDVEAVAPPLAVRSAIV